MDNPVTYELWHQRYDGRQDHDKLLGVYSTKEKTEKALALLRDKPGFRDHPDGFEILDGPIDETYWLEGFLSLWGDEEPDPNYLPGSGRRILFPSVDPVPQTYWVLWHRYVDEWGVLQEMLIGTYTSRQNAEMGTALVRDQPGFRDHPDGFVITQGTIDQTDMINGFVTVRDNGWEHDEPIQAYGFGPVEQIRQFQEWFDSVLAGTTGSRSRLLWGPSGTKYQAFKEAPYKDEFDEWLARIVCYAFSLPSTAFTRRVNRATAETAQDAALAEGLAPLMGWVKRLADHVIQDRMGEADLEFAWVDPRPVDPAEQAKLLDLYVRDGIYTVNEARDILGFEPVAGGDRAMVYGSSGAMPLAAPAADAAAAKRLATAAAFAKANFNPAELRDWHGRWTDEGGANPPNIRPAQELLPFAVRPPLFFDEPPETVRPFKEPIPRLSEQEGAKDVPSWARGNRPYVGENGRNFARRLMDDQYGRGNWKDNPKRWREYNQLKKFGDRGFRDPRAILTPDSDQI